MSEALRVMRTSGLGYENGVSAEQVADLEEKVRVLAAGLGLDEGFEIPVEVRRHVEAGETVQAVATLRRLAPGRLSLIAAKRMVDALGSR